jgi:hypothetical protein
LQLTFTTSNEYGQFTAPYPWLSCASVDNTDYESTQCTQLIEPYKETTLTAYTQSDTVLDASDSGDYDVIWYLNTQSSSSSEDDATVYSGNPITITVPAAGIYNLTMKVFDKKSLYLVDSRDTLLASK